MCVCVCVCVCCAVPSVPKAVNVTEQTEREVGLLVEWSAVSGRVTGYSVVVTVIDDRETQTFTTTDFKQLILSQEVGGYERVSVQVTAVNSAGSGPPSPAQISRTPPIGQCDTSPSLPPSLFPHCIELSLSLSLYLSLSLSTLY